MSEALRLQVKFKNTGPCGVCGIEVVVPEAYAQARREDHKPFFCPNGHSLSYRCETETEKLHKLLTTERRWREETQSRLEAERRRGAAARGQVTRLKNRLSKGECPCCGKQFTNLARHMAAKHPNWEAEE